MEWSAAYNTYYGSPIHIIDDLKLGRSYIAIVDFKGAQSIKNIYEHAHTIWITPPSLEVLKERLIARGANNPEDLLFRLSLAKKELLLEAEAKFFDYHLINDDFLIAKDMLKKIVVSLL
jgi:guanylate kinase